MRRKKDIETKESWRSQNNQAIRVDKREYQKSILKAVLTQFTLFIFFVIVVYLAMAATIVRVVPTQYGMIPSKNNTFEGGILPVNSQVHINLSGEVKEGPVDRLKQSVIPAEASAVVSVIAGPIGAVTKNPFSVNGLTMPEPIGFPADKEYLEDEYIGVCVEGACQPGSTVLFNDKQIIGVLLKDKPVPEILKAVNRPDTVSWDFMSAAHANSPEVACKLVSGTFLKTVGGVEGCKTYIGTWREYVGRDYDINNLVLNVVKDAGKEAVVEYDFTKNRANVKIRGTITLVNPNGEWLIDSVERK